MYNGIATQVRTGEVRLSYVNLNQPRQINPTDTPKYSVTLLLPKTDVATLEDIKWAIEAAASAAQGKLWNGVRPPNLLSLIHDGDGVREKTGVPYPDECKGCWVINASSQQKPRVVHQSNIKAELDPDDIYSGMYAQVMLNFYGYSKNGIGVGCGLGPLMKTREGEPLAGGISVEAAFSDVGCVAQPTQGSGATPAQPPYTPPAQPAYASPTPQGYGVTINPLTGQPA
jgi:hypothetical protein